MCCRRSTYVLSSEVGTKSRHHSHPLRKKVCHRRLSSCFSHTIGSIETNVELRHSLRSSRPNFIWNLPVDCLWHFALTWYVFLCPLYVSWISWPTVLYWSTHSFRSIRSSASSSLTITSEILHNPEAQFWSGERGWGASTALIFVEAPRSAS